MCSILLFFVSILLKEGIIMNQNKIALFISKNRKKQKMTQEELAQKIGVSINAVSKWERGLNLPDASIMKELCQILNITLVELFDGEYKNLEVKNLYKIFETNHEGCHLS